MKTAWPKGFKGVELRIGDHDSAGKGLQQLSANPLVGYLGEGNSNMEHVFKLARPVSGRFLTLQMPARNNIQVDEVNVIVAV